MSKRDDLREKIADLKRKGMILTADSEQLRERPERRRRVDAVSAVERARRGNLYRA